MTIDGNNNIVDESDWVLDISSINYGKCFTLNPSVVDIGTEMTRPLTIIYAERNASQYSFIHDPDFYILGPNPRTMPRIFTMQTPSYGTKMMYIDTVEHVKMNLPATPCQEAESYSLTRCIRDGISKKIGCRPEWDGWSDPGRTLCTRIEQLFEYEEKFSGITNLLKSDIIKHTGCLLPCRYKEYKFADVPVEIDVKNRIKKIVRSAKTLPLPS